MLLAGAACSTSTPPAPVRALQPLTGVRGPWVAQLPELAFLRVRPEQGDRDAAVYSLVHNRAHTNVAFMFDEDERLDRAADTLTVARGYLGSYPNFVFDVEVGQIEAFAQALTAADNPAAFDALAERWGVRRTSSRFWSTIDWILDDFRHRQPTDYGLFDLNRYKNL